MPPVGPQLGSTIGAKYRLVRLLGQGGMGAVYEAENTFTHKRVAIKWMHSDLARDPEHAARLMREAQAAARVRHPNVVDVYDVGREGDSLFLVMEYLEGEPLTDLLERGGLPLPKVLALLLPAMRGVAAAHKAGVIHRDIKPDNIFLAKETDTAQPVPKVLDFGISKLEPRGAEQLALTKTGSTMGTPMYMSYEQLTGAKDIDARTDVYAFGVILYEAVTGKQPFEAQSFPELAIKIATTAPTPPKALRPELPTALEKLVQWAMAKDRDARIASMEALIVELEPFATEHGFRAQMTLDASTVPQLLSVAAAGLPTERRDSMGRFSTPMGGTIPSAARRAHRRPWLLATIVVATLLTFGAAIAARQQAAQRAVRTNSAPAQAKMPAPALAARKPAAIPEAAAPQLTPAQAPLAPVPIEPKDNAIIAAQVSENTQKKRAKRQAPTTEASVQRAAPAEVSSPKPELRAPTLEALDVKPSAAETANDKDFRAGKPSRGQF